jgi:hypothetical protein
VRPAALLPLLLAAAARAQGQAALAPHAHRGVCWVGGVNERGLAELKELGVEWISVTPFAYGQSRKDALPEGGRFNSSSRRGENVEDTRRITQAAHRQGLKVMIKPHVWFQGRGGVWHGDIAMTNAEDWLDWFRAYGTFLKPFVELAEEEKADAVCIGTELKGTTMGSPEHWQGMIKQIRAIYHGPLTYAAHWEQEFEAIPFWQDLDWIGVQSYFPLSDKGQPTVEDLCKGWQPWLQRIEAVAKKHQRPVLFPEMGYRPNLGTAIKPWEWRTQAEFSEDAQADAYEAFFRTFSNRDWFLGCYVWKWFSSQPRRQDFSPQGLKGVETLRKWFARPVRESRPVR